MSKRATLEAALDARLQRVAEQRDLAPVLEVEAVKHARELTELLGDDEAGTRSQFLLGWLYWYRYCASPEGQGQSDLESAIGMLAPCMLGAIELQELPGPLLPILAEQSAPVALALFEQALHSADVDMIAAIVDTWGRLVSATPDGHPNKCVMLSNLGLMLHKRFERMGVLADLDKAIANYRAGTAATPDTHPARADMMDNLARALRARFERIGMLADIEEAIQVARDAVAATPGDDPSLAGTLSSLGSALRARFVRTGTLTDLDEAIAQHRSAVAAASRSHPDSGILLSNLAISLQTRFGHTGVLADLQEAITVGREAVAVAPGGHPFRANALSNLGNALRTLFGQTGTLVDLDEAVRVGREAVAATPVDQLHRAAALSNLGNALVTRFELVGAPADLDEAVRVGREAVAATPGDHPMRAKWLSNLVAALLTRFERTSDVSDLEEAVKAARDAVEATPGGHPDRAGWLSNLGAALGTRFLLTGAPADLDDAIRAGREAVAATPGGHPDRALRQSALVQVLHNRFQQTGALADLQEAIDRGRDAGAATPSGAPDRASRLARLGWSLQSRSARTGALADLTEAIANLREAVAITPDNHAGRSQWLSYLGWALRARFERTGALADLDEAVQAGRASVAASPAGHRSRPQYLFYLASALQIRFERTGALADINEAIASHQEAVTITPGDHPNYAGWLSGLGLALRSRAERTGVLADLQEAVRVAQQAVVATPKEHPGRAIMLSNLCVVLQAQYRRTSALADLEEAVRAAREAVEAVPGDHPDRAKWLSNLGLILRIRAEQTGSPADLEEAVRVGREAVEVSPDDDPNQARWLSNLGIALRRRAERTGAQDDRDEAVDTFGRAARMTTAGPSVRIHAARAAAELAAAAQPARAADLLEQAVRLLPEIAPRQLERQDQQYALGGLSGLAGDAAGLVLAAANAPPAERAPLALRLLEAGRAVLFSQALEVRSDLTDLTDQYPALAARFIQLRDLLDQPSDSAASAALLAVDDQVAGALSAPDRIIRDRRQLAQDFANVIAEIQAKEGFGSFARPPDTAELHQQASAGPVVAFNVSQYRSDALLLTADGITSLPLPGLTMQAVHAQITAFHQALHSAAHAKTATERAAAQRQLSQTLRWLWDTAAGPILDALGYRAWPARDMPCPRLWWAPGGLMGLLPIHAAGHHDDPDGPGKRTVIDRVVSSYTPTITALRHARRHHRTPSGQGAPTEVLIVAMPTTPGLPGHGRLSFVPEEARMLASRLPGAITLTEPDPADDSGPSGAAHDPDTTTPNRANVLTRLASCSAAHFACHGANDPADPSGSRLLLHDHREAPLTVSALASVRLDHARLAYLSACNTALSTHIQLIDEAIHLTSAFQIAGYPHVIGTLWAIDDRVAVQIADSFYAKIIGEEPGPALNASDAAVALHEAVRKVRDAFPTTPSLWASHIHAGA